MGKTFSEVFIDDDIFWWHFGHSILHEFLVSETTADAANKGSSQVEVNTGPFFF